MKHMAKKGKIGTNKWGFRGEKWGFRGEKWVIGVEKIRVGNQTRKVKWCKMQVLGFKIDKHQGVRR